MSAIFLGHKTIISPDFGNFVVEPKAPKNYKDPAKISDYVQEAKNEIMANSSFKPFTAMVDEVTLCIDDTENLFEGGPGFKCHRTYKGAAELELFIEDLQRGLNMGMQAFTFQAYTIMRIVCMQAVKQGIKNSLVNHWILNHPKARGLIVDLPKVFLPSNDEVSRIGYINMFKYFGVSLCNADFNSTSLQCQKLYELYCVADKFKGLTVTEVSNA